MGWETRGNHRYYYRKHWVDGRVVGEYMGTGLLGEVYAELDALEREHRRQATVERRNLVEAHRLEDMPMAHVDDVVRMAMTAVLIANGYHTHKRQWRRAKVRDGQPD